MYRVMAMAGCIRSLRLDCHSLTMQVHGLRMGYCRGLLMSSSVSTLLLFPSRDILRCLRPSRICCRCMLRLLLLVVSSDRYLD